MIPPALAQQVEEWIAGDPNPADRAELAALLEDGGPAAAADLADRFAGRLQFGTAGLRGAVGAGPNRMNQAVVRRTTAALAGWLGRREQDAAARGVVIGCDARHASTGFAEEAAAVLAGAGISVHMLPPRRPTPLLAFAVRHLSAAAGIMITASHNPPADNGYKLYTADGAQIIPPADTEIQAAVDALGPLSQVPLARPGEGPVTRHTDTVARDYLDAIIAACPLPGGDALRDSRDLRVVYTPLHGVAGGLAVRAIAQAGFPVPHVVAAQAEPDPDFPTVVFPNPEEPGALDLALAEARQLGADLVLANDPDGDRLAVAVPEPGVPGGWRRLTGDQVGALLGAYLLERDGGGQRDGGRERDAGGERQDSLVATTVVSSTLLSKIAAAAGARYAETLTGFKWIVRAAERAGGGRFLFGYEEALGYAVGETVRDKDGLSAALALLSLAVTARAAGQTLLDRWDALEAAHGVHLTAQVTLATRSPAELMTRLRNHPPAALAGRAVTQIVDLAAGVAGLPPTDALTYHLPGARVVIRPSGTEPKLKAYLEVVEPAVQRPLAAARRSAAGQLGPLRAAVSALVSGERLSR